MKSTNSVNVQTMEYYVRHIHLDITIYLNSISYKTDVPFSFFINLFRVYVSIPCYGSFTVLQYVFSVHVTPPLPVIRGNSLGGPLALNETTKPSLKLHQV